MHRAAPAHPHADGGDLAGVGAVGPDPDARVAVEPADVAEPQVAAHVDDDVLDRADVGDRPREAPRAASQVQQRVADQLAGTVEGDVAATVGVFEFGADLLGRGQQVLGAGVGPERVDGMVFEQQQVVVGAVGEQAPLQGEGVAVPDAAEPADAERLPARHVASAPSAGQSAAQSVCSSTSRRRRRNDAA